MARAYYVTAAALLCAALLSSSGLAEPVPPVAVPAGTTIRFHVNQPLSSKTSKSGQQFTYTVMLPIRAHGIVIVPAGAQGIGHLLLAGHAGTGGHEGDLTLLLESVKMTKGRSLVFLNQRLEINGRNRKIMSGVLGFVPFVGVGAMFIRGSEIRIDVNTPVETVLQEGAVIVSTTAPPHSFAPPLPPSASPLPSPTSPSPPPSPTTPVSPSSPP
jgi:hypothetical protein